jgi:hypothetical protein
MRIVLVGGLAMLALSGIAAASASAALPEVVNKEGKALVKNKFTVEIPETERGFWLQGQSAAIGNVYCESHSPITGAFSGLKAGETTFTLKKCKGGPLGGKCTTTGSTTGEMALQFSLSLVYTSKTSKTLALLFTPHKPGHEKEDVTYSCSGINFTISSGFLVPVPQENVNKLVGVGEGLYFRAEATAGTQEVKQYENEKGEKVETYLEIASGSAGEKPVETGVKFEAYTKFEEGVEFKG